MTTFGKIFTVFVTFASLSFLGFAAVSTIGGPNFQAEHVERLPDYVFKKSVSPEGKTTWAVETRRSAESVQSSPPTLPAAIVAARKDFDTKLQKEIEELDRQIKVLEGENGRIAEAKRLIELDLKGLEKRAQELQSELDAMRADIKAESDKGIQKSQDSYAVRKEAERRREDVFRLLNHLEEIRTDHYRAVEQARKLEDLLVRIRGSIGRSERRLKQLKGYEE
jgi:hypothetical protein